MIIAFISLIISIISLLYVRHIIPYDIKVGMAPFQVDNRDDLREKYNGYFSGINEKFNSFSLKYRLAAYVPVSRNRDYDEVLKELETGEINMAFVSQGLYNAVISNITTREYDTSKFEIIGYKRMNNKAIYYSQLIWKKDGYIDKIGINFLSNIIDSVKIYFGNKYSTSSHIIPEIYLIEKGMLSVKNHETKDRENMIKDILNDEKGMLLGAISNEDFDRLDRNTIAKLNFSKLNIPIPYDVILVNKKWWKKLGEDKGKILNCMEMINGSLSLEKINRTTFVNLNIFKDYLASGIVYKQMDNDKYKVHMPLIECNYYKLNTNKDGKKIRIVVFDVDKENNMTMQEIGTGYIREENNTYILLPNQKIEIGYRILPEEK